MKTREQIELRDRKELSARQKQLAKPEYKLYLLVLCIVVVLIHIVDEIATNTPSMVESNAVKEFFLEQRINHLQQPYEVRYPEKKKLSREEKKAEKAKAGKSGVFRAIRYLFNHSKDLRWTIIAMIVFAIGMMGITDNINGIMSIVSFLLFVVGVCNGWNSWFIGVLYSGFLGGYWTALDYMLFMTSEKVPTKIRGSVLGALNLLQYIGIGVGMTLLTVAKVFISDEWIGIACAISAIPGMIAALILIAVHSKETVGTDFEALDAEAEAEWADLIDEAGAAE